MQIIQQLQDLARLQDSTIRQWLAERIALLCDGQPQQYCSERHGWYAVVEEGDPLDQPACQPAGQHLLQDAFGETYYGDPDWVSPFEWVADHGGFYEAVLQLGDEAAIVVIVPKLPGIDGRLLQLLASVASVGLEEG